jgi:hypothetical protein
MLVGMHMIFNGNPECLCVLCFLLPTVNSAAFLHGLRLRLISSPREVLTVKRVILVGAISQVDRA